MNDREIETKFNKLGSAIEVNLVANLLTRVPSLKNMARLKGLWLESNRITKIANGDVPPQTIAAGVSTGPLRRTNLHTPRCAH